MNLRTEWRAVDVTSSVDLLVLEACCRGSRWCQWQLVSSNWRLIWWYCTLSLKISGFWSVVEQNRTLEDIFGKLLWMLVEKFNFSLARFYKWWLKCALKVIVLSRSRVRAEEGFTFSISPNTFIRSLNWTHSAAIFSDITVLDPQSDNVCVTCQPPTVSIFSSAHVTLTSMWLCQNNLIGSEDAITTTCSPVRPLWWFSQARKRFLSRLRKPRIILQHSFIFFPNNMQLHNSPEGLPHLVVRYLSLLNSCLEAVWLSVYHERMFLHVQHKHPSHARPHRVWKAFRVKVKQSHARTDESNDRSLKCVFIEYFNRCTLKPFSALTQTFIQRCVCRQHTERVVKINRKWVRESAEKPNALTLISHN